MAGTGVKTQCAGYVAMLPVWQKCRDVMDGERKIHAGKVKYLLRLTKQSDESYNRMVDRTPFYNASWRTVAGLKGMMFRKPPTQEIPKGVEEYLKDVTLTGMSLDRLAQYVACDVLELGRIGLLVDYPTKPQTETEITVAGAEKLGLRPTIKQYKAESIINWQTRVIANKVCLSLIVLKEDVTIPDPNNKDFGVIYVEQYRVLDLIQETNSYRVRVFQIQNLMEVQIGSDIFPVMNNKPLNFIPFVFIDPDGTMPDVQDPPLIDLIDLNLKHYKVSAAYEHGCHFTALPTAWLAGFNVPTTPDGLPQELYLGSEAAFVSNDPNAKAGYLEFTGTGLKELRSNLDSKKQEMATLGARMLADTSIRQVETFGATAIKHIAENSILAAIAISCSEGIVTALEWFCQWAGVTGKIKYDINRDFLPVEMDGPTLTALMAAWQGGGLSEAEFFDLLKRGDLVAPDKTLADHQAEIDSAPPPAPANPQPGRLGMPTQEESDAAQIDKQKQLDASKKKAA